MSQVLPEISLVIPCYNEEGSLRALVDSIQSALNPLGISYEVVITDDCSTDRSWTLLKEIAAANLHFRIQRFKFNCGESAASWAGMMTARGRYIITLDADLQNDPLDIPKFLEALKHYDCVCGTRVTSRRQGDNFVKIISSSIANGVRNKLSDENITDAGCTYRAFRRECLSKIKFFKGAHRFLPTLLKMEDFTVAEIPVTNHPRFAGQSHYGIWNRLFKSFADLLAIRWMKKRMIRYEITEMLN
ncbi:MAG TPA: glycosyltransferase family 2 protein [Candidatus Brocadiaceae bacterium]